MTADSSTSSPGSSATASAARRHSRRGSPSDAPPDQERHGELRRMHTDAEHHVPVIETKTIYNRGRTESGKWINSYVFVYQLGKGQHGDVWYAIDHRERDNPKPVAIKQVKRKNPKVDRWAAIRNPLPRSPHTPHTARVGATETKIRKEIAIMKKVNHPHVVRLIEVIDDPLDEKIYMVMEYLGGGEIKWRTLDNEPALRVDQVRRICRDVILGLEYLHCQGIIHRDIKPANLLWTEDRRMVKIADFGVSHYSWALHRAHLPPTPSPAPENTSSAKTDKSEADKDKEEKEAEREADTDSILGDESEISRFAGTPMFLAPEIVQESLSLSMLNLGDAQEHANGQTAAAEQTLINQGTSSTCSQSQAHVHVQPTMIADESAPTSTAPTAPTSDPTSPSHTPSASASQTQTQVPTPTAPPKPEITKAIDVWAFGVTLYGLLFGKMPWRQDTEYRIYAAIRTQDWDVPETMGCDRVPVGGRRQTREKGRRMGKGRGKGKEEDELSEGYLVVDLLEKLLEKDADKRITLEGVKRHPWILRDMSETEARNWVRGTCRDEPSTRTPTEEETRTAISSILFKYFERGKRIFRALRPAPRPAASTPVRGIEGKASPRRTPSHASSYAKGKDVGVQSAPAFSGGGDGGGAGKRALHRYQSSGSVFLSKERERRMQRDWALRSPLGPAAKGQYAKHASMIDVGAGRRRALEEEGEGGGEEGEGGEYGGEGEGEFAPFEMWGQRAGSSRRTRRGSGSETSRQTARTYESGTPLTQHPHPHPHPHQPHIEISESQTLRVPSASSSALYHHHRLHSPSRVRSGSGSPQSPSNDTSPTEERPRSRASTISNIFNWLPGRLSRSSTYAPSPTQEPGGPPSASPTSQASPQTLDSPQDQPISTHKYSSLTQRRSADAFAGAGSSSRRGGSSRQSSGSERLASAMRASSWGEFDDYRLARPSEDHTSVYSDGRPLDDESYYVGAGGVARSPVSSLPTSGALSRVSSNVSLGPSQFSAAQLIFHNRGGEHVRVAVAGAGAGEELPTAADPASQDLGALSRQGQFRSPTRTSHSHSTSPLARPLYTRAETSARRTESTERTPAPGQGRYAPVFDSDGSSSVHSGSGEQTPSEELEYLEPQPSMSELYQQEDEESEEDSEENIPLEVKTRRPSVTITEASPSPPPLSRRRPSNSLTRGGHASSPSRMAKNAQSHSHSHSRSPHRLLAGEQGRNGRNEQTVLCS